MARAFDVYQLVMGSRRAELIDTVFYADTDKITEAEVKSSLVNHDGYDPDIRVVERNARVMNIKSDDVLRAEIEILRSALQFMMATRRAIDTTAWFEAEGNAREVLKLTDTST